MCNKEVLQLRICLKRHVYANFYNETEVKQNIDLINVSVKQVALYQNWDRHTQSISIVVSEIVIFSLGIQFIQYTEHK